MVLYIQSHNICARFPANLEGQDSGVVVGTRGHLGERFAAWKPESNSGWVFMVSMKAETTSCCSMCSTVWLISRL